MAPPRASASGSGAVRAAGYGQSCTNCARAKCKCMLRPNGDSCERCHRLGKECQQMVTSRRRQAKRTTASRTAQLEEKLDDLVSILKSSHQSSVHFQGVLPPVAPVPKSRSGTSGLDSLAEAATTGRERECMFNRVGPGQDSAATCGSSMVETTAREAHDQLAKMRAWLLNFPFMHIADDATPESLRTEQPFTWLCIESLTAMSVTHQRTLTDNIRRELGQRIVLDHDRSMDTLQGILLLLSWATQSTGPRVKPFLVLYCQLATTVIYEMGLLRHPAEEHFTAIGKIWGKKLSPIRERAPEEKRLALSLWFLTSMVGIFTGKMETLRWTSHLADCLEDLDRAEDHPSDNILATFIRLQLIAEDANKLLVRDLMGNHSEDNVPTYIHKQRLLDRLRVIRERNSIAFSAHFCLTAHLLSTEAHIQAIGLFSERPMPDDRRVDGLYQCLMSVRGWYDSFFGLPLVEIPPLPFHTYISLSSMQVMLYRLTTCDFPMWDKSIVRGTADVLEILDRTVDTFQRVPEVYPLKDDQEVGNLFVNGARHLKNLRATWQPVVAKHLGNIPTPNSQVLAVSPPEPPVGLSVPLLGDQQHGTDFNDISWMADIFGPWEL